MDFRGFVKEYAGDKQPYVLQDDLHCLVISGCRLVTGRGSDYFRNGEQKGKKDQSGVGRGLFVRDRSDVVMI